MVLVPLPHSLYTLQFYTPCSTSLISAFVTWFFPSIRSCLRFFVCRCPFFSFFLLLLRLHCCCFRRPLAICLASLTIGLSSIRHHTCANIDQFQAKKEYLQVTTGSRNRNQTKKRDSMWIRCVITSFWLNEREYQIGPPIGSQTKIFRRKYCFDFMKNRNMYNDFWSEWRTLRNSETRRRIQ